MHNKRSTDMTPSKAAIFLVTCILALVMGTIVIALKLTDSGNNHCKAVNERTVRYAMEHYHLSVVMEAEVFKENKEFHDNNTWDSKDLEDYTYLLRLIADSNKELDQWNKNNPKGFQYELL